MLSIDPCDLMIREQHGELAGADAPDQGACGQRSLAAAW